jgi:hypothetical protein
MSSDVAPQGRRPPKTATDYLAASGATAIAVTEIDGICTFRIGHKVDFAISVQWALSTMAKSIVKQARLNAGLDPDAATAGRALTRAAVSHRQLLTSNDAAMARAGATMERIDAAFKAMNRSGQMQEFNRMFRRRRNEAAAEGKGFMTFSAAMGRLRQAIVKYPAAEITIGPVESLFTEVLR